MFSNDLTEDIQYDHTHPSIQALNSQKAQNKYQVEHVKCLNVVHDGFSTTNQRTVCSKMNSTNVRCRYNLYFVKSTLY